jgi:ABC-type xylose transport system permease subunit
MASINACYQYIAKGFIMLVKIRFDVYQLNRARATKNKGVQNPAAF